MPRDASGKIISEQAFTLHTARADLLAAENERVALEAQVAGAITNGEVGIIADLAGRFAPVKARIVELHLAIEAATSAEDKRLAAAHLADQQARIRAGRAHLAQAQKFGRSAIVARRDAAQALRSTIDAINSCAALMPEDTIGAFAEIDLEAAMQAASYLAADERLPSLLAGIAKAQSDALAAMAEALPATPEQDAA
jgi:hypothetical protein